MSYIRLNIGSKVPTDTNVYTISKYIGHGGYSNVWMLESDDSDPCVIKVFRSDEDYDKWAQTEIDILNLVKAQDVNNDFCIIKAISDIEIVDPTDPDIIHKAVILPYRESDLYDYLKNNHPINLSLIKQITINLIKAFYFLHKKGVIHGDIKLDNILVQEGTKKMVDITDFSLSVKYQDKLGEFKDKDYYRRLLYDKYHLQTLEYKSPELICQSGFNTTVDTWAFGVMLYKLLTDKYPFRYDKLEDFTGEEDDEEEDDESFTSADDDEDEIEYEYMQINYILHDIFSKLEYNREDINHLKRGNKYYKYFNNSGELHFGFSKPEQPRWNFLRLIDEIYRSTSKQSDIDWVKNIIKDCLKVNINRRATFKELYLSYCTEK